MPENDAPPLSVIIPTNEAWPYTRATLESVRDQARALGAELIVADGNGRGLPDDPSYSDVVRIEKPGASVFHLRALGIARARGDVIAITEDHVVIEPDWCEQVLRAHRERPEAAVIGGAIENGATEGVIDWASFLLTTAPSMRPLSGGNCAMVATAANLSYKRRVIPRTVPPAGLLEMAFNRALRARGEKLVADDRLVVHHVQSWNLLDACRIHFHNGRAMAGLRLGFISPLERILRLGTCAILPAWLVWRTISAVCAKRRAIDRAIVGLPFIGLFAWCHAVGELLGYTAGPGGSPEQLP